MDTPNTLSNMIKCVQSDQKTYDALYLHHRLLKLDERPAKTDLEYWIDYSQLFGASDLIPLYDKMVWWKFRNYDVYATYFVIFIVGTFFWYNICKCCCSCCCGSKK
jgi:hypothetical protein